MPRSFRCSGLLLLALSLLLGASCRKDPPEVAGGGPCPPGQYSPQCSAGGPGPGPGPTTAPPPGAPAGAAPAFGMPCASDADFVCPLGRCVGGRCGGCTSSADCKSGASCGWTPLGMACVPGLLPGAPAGPAGPGLPPPGPVAGDPFASARQQCVDRTNQYRASVGARPVARVVQQEACLDQQARSDGSTGSIHGAFGRCNEGAQNECPGWRGPPDSMVGPCLKMMFDEGPGPGSDHGHYTNMVNPQYTGVACGFFVTASGQVWMVQDFF